MTNATIHDQLYVLALVYTNDIDRLRILNESNIIKLDFNYSYKIPIPLNCDNVMDVINDLLLINGFFADLNDFICKNRLFQILFAQNNIDRLVLNEAIPKMFKDNFYTFPNELTEHSLDSHNEPAVSTDDSSCSKFFEMTLLKVAVLMEYESMLNYLITCGASSSTNPNEIHPIHLSLYQNNISLLRILLDQLSGSFVQNKLINDLTDNNGLNPLHLAVYNQCTESIRLLYRYGGDINHLTSEVKYPLIWAMETYEIDDRVIEYLLELGGDVNKIDPANTLSPLIVAIISDRYELVRLVLKHGANVNQKFEDSYTNPLKIAIDFYRENQNGELILIALLDAGACLNFDLPEIIKNPRPMLELNQRLNYDITDEPDEFDAIMNRVQLLNQTNELNLNRSYRRYPLIFAIYIGCHKLVKFLLKYGAYPHTTTFDFYSPFSSACYVDNREIVELLLASGVDPTLNCYRSNTPLTIAAARNDSALATRLLEFYKTNESLNVQDSNGDFALLYAAYNRNTKLVGKLLESGANCDLLNRHNAYALWYTVFNNDHATFFELIKYATDLETKSYGIDYQNFETVPQIIYDTAISPIIVAELNHFYNMIYYLYCLGVYISAELRERVGTKLNRFYEAECKLENRDFKKLKLLDKLLNRPLSLTRICRKSIRASGQVKACVENRDLPETLRKFLLLEII